MAKLISSHAPAGKGGQTVEAPPPPEVYDKSYLHIYELVPGIQ